MARRRFSRIRQGPRLAQAFQRYQAYQEAAGTRPRRPRAASSRPGGFVRVQVRPFGIETTTPIRIGVSRRARTLMEGDMGNFAPDASPEALSLGGFTPAKVVLFVQTGTDDDTSEITGLEYLARRGAAYTHGFGGSTATQREMEAYNILSRAIIGSDVNRKVSYQPERFYQEL